MHERITRSSMSTALIIVVIAECVVMPYGYADVTTNDLMSKSADAFAHTIDLLVTLDLALFALVGYFAKDRLAGVGCKRTWQLLLLTCFFVAGCASLYFAYSGHLEIGAQLANGKFDYKRLYNYVWQAFSLLVATSFGGAFVRSAL